MATNPKPEDDLYELPRVVPVPDQPCQQLYEANPVLLGFDVVHYHQIPSYKDGGVAKQGLPGFAYNFNGYQFWFLSQENRNLFIGDPWKYAPAWGGFCSWGIARERKPSWPWEPDWLGPPASPWEGWSIVDGVLIFNIWESYTDRFLEEAETNMALAAERWKELNGGELRAGPFNTHCIGHGMLENWCLTQQPAPWLEPLPECGGNNATVFTNTAVEESKAAGGGIVSDLDSFRDFGGNTRTNLSPYQKRLIGIGVPIGIVLLVLVFVWLCSSRKIGKRGTLSPKIQKTDEKATKDKNLDSSEGGGSSKEEGLPL